MRVEVGFLYLKYNIHILLYKYIPIQAPSICIFIRKMITFSVDDERDNIGSVSQTFIIIHFIETNLFFLG